jgi:succinate dehydrogenase hydrophobic anchor subunit
MQHFFGPSAHWLFQRATAVLLLPTIILSPSIQVALICFNLLVLCHLYLGFEEILADYVHHEVTRTILLVFLKIMLLIISKYVFVFVLTVL